MIADYSPGDLVKADWPNFIISDSEQQKLGIIVALVPPHSGLNKFAVTQLLVFWVGPHASETMTLEPDHRLHHV